MKYFLCVDESLKQYIQRANIVLFRTLFAQLVDKWIQLGGTLVVYALVPIRQAPELIVHWYTVHLDNFCIQVICQNVRYALIVDVWAREVDRKKIFPTAPGLFELSLYSLKEIIWPKSCFVT